MRLGCRIFQLFKRDWEQAFSFADNHGLQSIQMDDIDETDVNGIKEQMNRTGIKISSIGAMSVKLLGPNMEQSSIDQGKVKQKILLANRLGVPLASQFAGNNPNLSFKDNIEMFKKVFTPLVALAEDNGIKLVFENCPLINGTPPVVQNLAYSPAAWEAMFEAIPSTAMGLEFDTGHPPMLGMDMQRCIKEYKDRIYHVHIKDCKINTEHEYKYGRLGKEFYDYEIPGRGNVDFHEVISTLNTVGYRNDVTLDLRPTTIEAIEESLAYIAPILRANAN